MPRVLTVALVLQGLARAAPCVLILMVERFTMSRGKLVLGARAMRMDALLLQVFMSTSAMQMGSRSMSLTLAYLDVLMALVLAKLLSVLILMVEKMLLFVEQLFVAQ